MFRGQDKDWLSQKEPIRPYSRLLQLMQLSGQLSSGTWGNKAISLVAAVMVGNGCLGPILFACLADVPLEVRFETAIFGSGALNIFLKFYNAYTSQPRIRRVLALLAALDDREFREAGQEAREEFRTRDGSALRTLFLVLNALPPLMVLKALVSGIYPYACWTPLDLEKYYAANFIWQTITITFVMFYGGICYSFLFLTINQCVLNMRVLLIREVNELFSWQMANELALFTLQIAFAGYNAMKMYSMHAGFGPVSVSLYVVFLYTSFAYFLCLCGHKITVESERIYESIYESKWYERPIQDQKSIKIMLCFALKNLGLRYKNILVFGMARYTNLMNATYSYLTLLSNMEI